MREKETVRQIIAGEPRKSWEERQKDNYDDWKRRYDKFLEEKVFGKATAKIVEIETEADFDLFSELE